MKRLIPIVFLPALVASAAVQSSDADRQWQALRQSAHANLSSRLPPGPKNRAQLAQARASRADLAWQTAQSARDFHTRFPTHPAAEEARQVEAIASLHGAVDHPPARQNAAAQVARAFAEDRRHTPPRRFEVAVLAERFDLARRKRVELFADDPEELERIAEKLAGEFGHLTEFYDFYAAIGRAAGMETGRRIARRILQGPASPAAKAEAQAIQQRLALIGQPLNTKIISTEGEAVDLAQPRDGPTLICAWDGSHVNFGSLRPWRRTLQGVTMLYYAPHSTRANLAAARTSAPVPGKFCTDPLNLRGKFGETLRVRSNPLVFVLNRQGVLQGYGRPAEIPALLALARN